MKARTKKSVLWRSISIAALGLALTFATSCGREGADLKIMAAASLSDVFQDISEAFESETGIETTLYTAGSSTLATQIIEGARADVVGLADEKTMGRILEARQSFSENEVQIFATNHLVLVTPNGNPASISSFQDLSDAIIAVCAPTVPCGSLAYTFAESEGVVLEPASVEPNVRSVRTKVELGEVDAGLIYVTDLTHNMEVIDVPGLKTLETKYPITALQPEKGAAKDFIAFVVSDLGQTILADYGFGKPHENN